MSLNFLVRKFPTSLIASNPSILRFPKPFPTNQTVPLRYRRSYTVTMTKGSEKDTSKHNNKDGHEHTEKDKANAADEAHQFQSGATTHRKEDEWKHRAPYAIHKDDKDFDAKWKGGCHCGKVKYELSREKPLATKYCHCSTCQRLHGVSQNLCIRYEMLIIPRRRSSGQPSSTRKTSTSLMEYMTLAGMTQQTSRTPTTCHARFNVRSVEHLSWTKAET